MNVKDNLPFLESLAKGVSDLFGDSCEVTVHDLTEDEESTIVAIENGHVTGRHIGDGATEMVLKALKEGQADDNTCYLARTKEGRMVKSSTVYIRDEGGKPVGIFGINYDITDLIMAQLTIEKTVSITEPETNNNIEAITTNVVELLDLLIEEADAFVGKPVAMMTKDDKTKAIQFLNDKGAFLIKKAGDKVSKHYDISKYTLYNYMDAEPQ